jgi:hypothetical protein
VRRVLLALFLCACGDPLVEGGYRGEPIFKVRGETLFLPSPVPGEEITHRASAFWNVDAAGSIALVEQTSVTTEVFLPDVFDVIFFLPPEPQHFQSPSLAVGILIIYADADRDGRWSEGTDGLLAVTTRQGFTYSVSTGFSIVELPTQCPELAGAPESVPPAIGARRCDSPERSCGDQLCDPTHLICVPARPLQLDVSTSTAELSGVACR